MTKSNKNGTKQQKMTKKSDTVKSNTVAKIRRQAVESGANMV